jgi:hypothetical protein
MTVALVVVALAVKLVVHRSLKPVVTIQSAIASREAFDLTPLPDAGLRRKLPGVRAPSRKRGPRSINWCAARSAARDCHSNCCTRRASSGKNTSNRRLSSGTSSPS